MKTPHPPPGPTSSAAPSAPVLLFHVGQRMKIALAATLLALAVAGFAVWRVATQESGFLWMSQAESVRIFTRRIAPHQLERFRSDMGRYPTSAEGFSVLLRAPEKEASKWKGPYLDARTTPKDPWGHEYRYRALSSHHAPAFEVFSLGPDGKISADDIGNFSK